jgi:hypothetical protein
MPTQYLTNSANLYLVGTLDGLATLKKSTLPRCHVYLKRTKIDECN